MLTLEFDFWIVVEEKWNEKIIPYAAVLKENKYRKSLCDIDALWYQKEMADSCYISKIFDYWGVPLSVEIAQN